MVEKKPNIYADQITHNFLLKTKSAGVIDELISKSDKSVFPQKGRYYGNRPFVEELNITISYYSSNESLDKVAKAYTPRGREVYTREHIRQVVKRTITKIWEASSQIIREDFPLESIPLKKPLSQKVKRRIFEKNGNHMLRLEQLVKEGANEDELKIFMRENHMNIRIAKNSLKRWDVNLPVATRVESKSDMIKALTDPGVSEEDFVTALNRLSKGDATGLSESGVVMSLSDLFGITQLTVAPRKISHLREVLVNEGVHLATYFHKVNSGQVQGKLQRYDYIAQREFELAKKIAKTSPDLQRYRESPINVVAGVDPGKYITVFELMMTPNYIQVRELLRKIGAKIGRKVPITEFLNSPDCPTEGFLPL